MDSDDTLVKNALEILVKNALETNADIVSPGYRSISKEEILNRKPKARVVEGKEKWAMDTSGALKFLNIQLIRSSLWKKVTYSTRRFVEDTPTFVKLIFFAKKRSIIEDLTYNYYQNENSLCHQASDDKMKIYIVLCAIDSYKFFKEQGAFYPISVIFMRLSEFNIDTVNGFEEEKKEIVKFLNDYIK